MEAPQSSDSVVPLYALAKLGRSKDIQQAKLSSSKFGYVITKSDSQFTNPADVETIKKTIKEIPVLLKEGIGDRSFYEDVRTGIGKIHLNEKERNEVDAIARHIFSKSQHEMANPSLVKGHLEMAAKAVESAIDAATLGNPNQSNILQEEFIIEGEEEKIEQERNAKARAAANATPLQLRALDLVRTLVSPANREYVLSKIGNLSFIENKEDFKVFQEFINALIKNRDLVAPKLRKGSLSITEEMKFIYEAFAKVEQRVLNKANFSQEEKSLYRKTTESFLEQVFPLNTQISQDIFSNDPGSYRFKRRIGNINELQRKLSEQNMRESEVKPRMADDFTSDEKMLVQEGFIKRESGFNVWEKSEWVPSEEIVVNEKEQILVKATLTCSLAIPGQKPVEDGVDFDFSKFGELTPSQAKQLMGYLEDFIFRTKKPKFPQELEFLSEIIVKDQDIDEFEVIADLQTKSDEDFEVLSTDPLKLTAKNALIAMAQDKKNEVLLMITKANFQVNHPEIPL